MRTLIQKTIFLSGTHCVVRVMGFFLRIFLSRELGPQAMGLVELAQSAQMLLIAPVISGLPAAVSRLSAKAKPAEQVRVLRCALGLSAAISLPLMVLAFFFREPLSLWLGDVRTLPALLFYLPCIPILGASCVLNGYFYGLGRPVPPALSELLEQGVRLLLCLRLTAALRGWPLLVRASIPAFSALAGETIGLFLMFVFCIPAVCFQKGTGSRRAVFSELFSLALPLTGMRVVSSLMHTVNAVLIPARLQMSGLPAQEALSLLGMFQGMLMPILMMPSFVTVSLCMTAAPEITRRQAQKRPLRSLMQAVLRGAFAAGLAAGLAVWGLAPFFAQKIYRQAELLPLLRLCWPLVPLMALTQAASGTMNALGLQRISIRISLGAHLLAALLVYVFCALPAVQLRGAVLALFCSQAMILGFSLRALRRAVTR